MIYSASEKGLSLWRQENTAGGNRTEEIWQQECTLAPAVAENGMLRCCIVQVKGRTTKNLCLNVRIILVNL